MQHEPFQCTEFVAANQQCIRFEGHSGEHSAGPKPSSASVCDCPVCGKRFASVKDFDAHVPCPKP
jgi:hypothetical protein